MAQMEKEMKDWRQKQLAIKMIFFTVLIGGAYFGWDYLPEQLTDIIESLWSSMKGLFAKKPS